MEVAAQSPAQRNASFIPLCRNSADLILQLDIREDQRERCVQPIRRHPTPKGWKPGALSPDSRGRVSGLGDAAIRGSGCFFEHPIQPLFGFSDSSQEEVSRKSSSKSKKKEDFLERMVSTLPKKSFPQICVVTGSSCLVFRDGTT